MTEAMIDSAIARRFFPSGNPIGATMQFGKQSFTIIGVVDQARMYEVHTEGRPQILVRNSEDFYSRPLFFVMRTTREPHSLLPEVGAAVRRIDPRIPVGEPRAMDDIVQASLSSQSMGATLIGAFAS